MTHACPPEHKHAETTTCYKNHRCRCEPCDTAFKQQDRWKQRDRRRRKAYGTFVPEIPATGTHRRIQGLQLLGWTLAHIGAETGGITGEGVRQILGRKHVEPSTAARVEHACRVLLGKGRGPSVIATRRAERRGWLSPLAWDDIDHDPTPATKPDRDPTLVDDVRIMHAIDGQPGTKLTPTERRAAVQILYTRRWSDARIAQQLGCHEKTVYRIRHDELGLPAYEYAELIKQEAA